MRYTTKAVIASMLAITGAAAAQQAFLSELFINPPGSGDNGRESVEITGTPGLQLTGWKLIVLEGDISATLPAGQWVAGTVDQIIDLSNYTIGSNGVLLIRDAAGVLLPAPAAATSVVVQDFNPDLENGGNTYILGFGTLPSPIAIGFDLDTNDDGVLDQALTGFTTIDAVGLVNGDEDGLMYAAELGGVNIPRQLGPVAPWTPDAIYRWLTPAGGPAFWVGGDLFANAPSTGPFFWDDSENYNFDLAGVVIPFPNTTIGLDLGTLNQRLAAPACYANCDGSTAEPTLNALDFACFLNRYRAGESYANCDGSTAEPTLNALDFACFLNRYRAGCR